MKLYLTLCLLIIGYTGLLAQNKSKALSISVQETNQDTAKSNTKPYVVLFYNNKVYGYSSDSSTNEESSVLQRINPDWIEQINILKGEGSIKKYGAQATNGTMEITLKETVSKKKLKPLLDKFKLLIE